VVRTVPRDRLVLVPGGFVGAVINLQGPLPRLRLLVMRTGRGPVMAPGVLPALRFGARPAAARGARRPTN
jgi:hypothetical protein